VVAKLLNKYEKSKFQYWFLTQIKEKRGLLVFANPF
jgi:hypothetical protein